jgi:hypothetical protein
MILATVVLGIAQGVGVNVSPRTKNEDVRSYYNASENRTTVSVSIALPIEVSGEASILEINAHSSFPGQGRPLITPKDVQLVLSVPCNIGSELGSDPIICVDGECSSYHPRGEANVCAGGLGRERTSRMIDLPSEAFLKIAGGQKVRIKFGNSEAELSAEQIKALHRLARRITLGIAAESLKSGRAG